MHKYLKSFIIVGILKVSILLNFDLLIFNIKATTKINISKNE